MHGIKRRASSFNTSRIDHLYQDPHESDPRLVLHYGDLTDSTNLIRIIQQVQPDEIYNLGAQSHVAVSFESPEYTANSDALGTLRILEAVRILGLTKKHGSTRRAPVSSTAGAGDPAKGEHAVLSPQPLWCREALCLLDHGKLPRELWDVCLQRVLFNHESPRRGETFVTRKITRGLARVAAGLDECLFMGNLDSLRDWGHARDYVEMQWLMLQQEQPEDFVIATGRQESVRRFIELAAEQLAGGRCNGTAKELAEVGRRGDTGAVVVKIDPRYFRPAEVETLLGDPSKAKDKLGWTPTTTLEELVAEMVATDVEEAKKEAYLKRKGFAVVGARE